MKIQLTALLISIHTLISCQQDPTKVQRSEAGVNTSPINNWITPENMVSTVASNLVFRSSDAGNSWEDVSAGLPMKAPISRITVENGLLYLSADFNLFTGNAQAATPDWTRESYYDNEIGEVYAGKAGQYISSYKYGLFRKVMGSEVLISLTKTLKDKTVRTFLETPEGALLVGCESGIYKSDDEGNTWKQVNNEAGVSSFGAANGVLLSGTYKGILRSTDGGEHWTKVFDEGGAAFKTSYLNGRFVCIMNGDKKTQVDRMCQIYSSTDNGVTWQRIDQNLRPSNTNISVQKIYNYHDLKQSGKYLFCSTEAGIFRTADWGGSWELVFPTEDNKTTLQLGVWNDVIFAVSTIGC